MRDITADRIALLEGDRERLHGELISTAAWLEELGTLVPTLKTPKARATIAAKIAGRAKLIRLIAGMVPQPSYLSEGGGT